MNKVTIFAYLPVFIVLNLGAAPHWIPQPSHSAAGLRGLSAVSRRVAWASGTEGTVLRTLDGGEHWQFRKVNGGERLDFRDVEAFSDKRALVLASGMGGASRVYSTTDGGESWTLVLSSPDEQGFFDAMKFWSPKRGILLGDPVAGRFVIYTTANGGLTWARTPGPAAIAGEGAFAASGTCVTVYQSRAAWFGTGGPNAARVLYTIDGAKNWKVAATAMSGTTPSEGIFSLVFTDSKHGVAVGGNYRKPEQTARTVVVTNNGGETWVLPAGENPHGFRSAVAYLDERKMLIAAGTNGSDYSLDDGLTWQRLSNDNLNAVANHDGGVWAIGPKGLILKLAFDK